MNPTVINSGEARARWRDLLDGACAGQDTIIERSGQPVAALIPYADYQAILAELDDRRASPEVIAAYEEWKRDPSTGTPYEQFRAELIAEGLLEDSTE